MQPTVCTHSWGQELVVRGQEENMESHRRLCLHDTSLTFVCNLRFLSVSSTFSTYLHIGVIFLCNTLYFIHLDICLSRDGAVKEKHLSAVKKLLILLPGDNLCFKWFSFFFHSLTPAFFLFLISSFPHYGSLPHQVRLCGHAPWIPYMDATQNKEFIHRFLHVPL